MVLLSCLLIESIVVIASGKTEVSTQTPNSAMYFKDDFLVLSAGQ